MVSKSKKRGVSPSWKTPPKRSRVKRPTTTATRHTAPQALQSGPRQAHHQKFAPRTAKGSLRPAQVTAHGAHRRSMPYAMHGKGNVSSAFRRPIGTWRGHSVIDTTVRGRVPGLTSAFRYRSPPWQGSRITTRDATGSTRPIHAVDARRSTKRQDWVPAETVKAGSSRKRRNAPVPLARSLRIAVMQARHTVPRLSRVADPPCGIPAKSTVRPGSPTRTQSRRTRSWPQGPRARAS